MATACAVTITIRPGSLSESENKSLKNACTLTLRHAHVSIVRYVAHIRPDTLCISVLLYEKCAILILHCYIVITSDRYIFSIFFFVAKPLTRAKKF